MEWKKITGIEYGKIVFHAQLMIAKTCETGAWETNGLIKRHLSLFDLCLLIQIKFHFNK